jgi:hypothetical protein
VKFIPLILLVILGPLSADEVRSYRVEVDLLQKVETTSSHDPFAEDDSPNDFDLAGPEWLGPVVKKVVFESRFLKTTGELRDCSKRINAILGEELKAEAIYDLGESRLIVKTSEGAHRVLRFAIRAEHIEMIRTTVALYQIPGAGLGDRTGFWDEVPGNAKLLKEFSWTALSGAPVSLKKRGFKVESEIQWDAYEGYLDSRLTLGIKTKEGSFTCESGHQGVTGVKWAQEVGSYDGKSTLMLVSHHDPVFPDGRRWAEWIEKEDGFFLEEERLETLRWKDPSETSFGVKPGQESAAFLVPPTFMTFLSGTIEGVDQNPFALEEGDVSAKASATNRSIRKLLEQNGVTFREGDSVAFLRESNTLLAKLSPMNLELLDGIVNAVIGQGPPEYSYLEFSKVEGEPQGRVRKRMVVPFYYGQSTKMTMGDDSAIEVEVQADLSVSGGEMLLSLGENGRSLEEADFSGRFEFRFGKPVLFKSEVNEGVRTSWYVTARRKVLERELAQLVKARKARK